MHAFELSSSCSPAVFHPAICRFEDETNLSLQTGVSTLGIETFPLKVLQCFLFFCRMSKGEFTSIMVQQVSPPGSTLDTRSDGSDGGRNQWGKGGKGRGCK